MSERAPGPARGSDDGFLSAWQRVAVGICVALPVPVFAGTGLALPLPSVVYRLAVAAAERTEAVAVQLSGFDVVTAQDAATARVGTIRLTESERAAAGSLADPEPTNRGHRSTTHSAGTAHLTAAVSPRGKSSAKLGGDAAITVREAAPVLEAPTIDGGAEGRSTSSPPEASAASGEGGGSRSEPKEKGSRSDDRPEKAKPAQADKGPRKAGSPEDSQAAPPGQEQGEPQKDKPKDQEEPPAVEPGQEESDTPGNGQGTPGNGQGGAQDPGHGHGSGQDGSNGGGSDKTPPGKAG